MLFPLLRTAPHSSWFVLILSSPLQGTSLPHQIQVRCQMPLSCVLPGPCFSPTTCTTHPCRAVIDWDGKCCVCNRPGTCRKSIYWINEQKRIYHKMTICPSLRHGPPSLPSFFLFLPFIHLSIHPSTYRFNAILIFLNLFLYLRNGDNKISLSNFSSIVRKSK